MDWKTQIEKQKSIIVGGILLIAIGSLVVTALRGPLAHDPFWHLQMGKDWLENGLSPWIDHYSFTFNGQPITNPPVIFQLLLHSVVSQFGVQTGFLIVRFGGFLLTLGAVVLLLRQMKATAVVYALVVPMIVFLLHLRPLVRPELFSYTFSVVALMLYFRAGNKISIRNMLPIVALMWVWSIYHSSVVGYVIFLGFFLDCAVAQFKSRAAMAVWLRWFMWGVLVVAVGFLNPSYAHPLIQAATFPSEWKDLISEYMPIGARLLSYAGIYVLLLFVVLTPLMALKQRKLGVLLIWAVLVYNAILMQRMVTPSGIVVVLLAAHLLTHDKSFRWLSLSGLSFWNKLFWLVCLGSLSVTLYSDVRFARFYITEKQPFIGRYPLAIADYMTEKRMSGRIFNAYGMGGYLIYRLAPRNQVYIDGRTQILYPLEHLKRYNELYGTDEPEVFRAELDKYAIDQIIWQHSQLRHDLVQNAGDFGLDFMDARFVLYTRGASNFPLLGKLLSKPECWRPEMLDDLNSERQRMDNVLPQYSPLFPFADLVVGYSNAEDGKAYIDANINGNRWFDEMRRFAGYRFLELGENELVALLLGGVELRKPKDYLGSVFATLRAGNIDLATRILDEFSNANWRIRLKTEEIFIQYKLYQLISIQRDLTSVEQENAEALKVILQERGYSNLGPEYTLGIESFCASSERQSDMP